MSGGTRSRDGGWVHRALLRSLAAGLDRVDPGPARSDPVVQPVELLRQLGMAWAVFRRGGTRRTRPCCPLRWASCSAPRKTRRSPNIGPGTRKNYVANFGGPANFMAWSGVLVPLKDNPPLDYAGRLLEQQQRHHVRDRGDHRRQLEHGAVQRDAAGFRSRRLRSRCPRRLGRARTCGLCHSTISGTRAHRAASRRCCSCRRARASRASPCPWGCSRRPTATSGSPATPVPA